jgi:CheY-like chemotaxis protein
LAELDRAKTEFFANISHEFRTPLTLMMGPVEELRAAAQDADRARLDMIYRNGLRLGRLVNNLLEFSRIQAGHTEPHYQRLDLAVLTADLAAVLRAATDRAGLQLVVDCPPLPEPVWADRDMWEKVVLNLVSNAVKYTRAGTITVTLRPTASPADACPGGDRARGVVLTVADTGIGVTVDSAFGRAQAEDLARRPADELPRLFDRFHRVPDPRARSIEGSGIGLALTQQLIEAYGGAITVTSTLDVGTAFTVTLPGGTPAGTPGGDAAAPPALPSAGDRSPSGSTATSGLAESFAAEAWGWLDLDPGERVDRTAPAATAGATPPVTPGRERGGGRVLVVDDNADMRAYLTRLLSPVYEVEAVGDGSAGLAAARADRPDLIVTDLMLPGLDGFELLAALRADPATVADLGEPVDGFATPGPSYVRAVRARLQLDRWARDLIRRTRRASCVRPRAARCTPRRRRATGRIGSCASRWRRRRC